MCGFSVNSWGWDQTQNAQWTTQDHLTWYQQDPSAYQAATQEPAKPAYIHPAAAPLVDANRMTAKQIIAADSMEDTDFPTVPMKEVRCRA